MTETRLTFKLVIKRTKDDLPNVGSADTFLLIHETDEAPIDARSSPAAPMNRTG